MKHLLILFSAIGMWLILSGCGSKKKNAGTQPDVPVFGIYKFSIKGKAQIQLNSDSTVVSEMSNTPLQKSIKMAAVKNEGTFSIRNDSIFINWSKGTKVKSKFVKKDGVYSFLIGSTPYERKL